MSYDIEVFSTDEPSAPSAQEGRGWQIAIDGPMRVEPEDIPDRVRTTIPGLRFLTRLHLQGEASAAAEKTLITSARELARAARGVIVDQQQGTIETPRGVQRLQIAKGAKSDSVLQLSWFVHDIGPLTKTLPAGIIDTFERTLPECLPRRYGLYEPPQFKLEAEGLDHFRQFLRDHLQDTPGPVWYCETPCQFVFVSIPDRVGPTPRGFRCGRLTLNVDGKAGGDRAWRVELTRLWLAIADLIKPFYAEIRAGECPIKSWWWNGIPAPPPSAVLLGEPYASLWSDFGSAKTSSTGLRYMEHFVEPNDARMPSPPPGIAQRRGQAAAVDIATMLQAQTPLYPDIWPFDGPTC